MGRKEGKYKKKARSSKSTGRLKEDVHKFDEICKSILNYFTSRRWLGACLSDTSYHETKWSLDIHPKGIWGFSN